MAPSATPADLLDPFANRTVVQRRIPGRTRCRRPRLRRLRRRPRRRARCEAASFAGWHVTVVDDRPDFPIPRAFPSPIASSPASSMTCSPARVSTRHLRRDRHARHQHDAVIAARWHPGRFATSGMLRQPPESRAHAKQLARVGCVRKPFRASMRRSAYRSARIRRGIAVSIVAEMIAVRRASSTRRGLYPRRLPRSTHDAPGQAR